MLLLKERYLVVMVNLPIYTGNEPERVGILGLVMTPIGHGGS
jgi:hypothetical protein